MANISDLIERFLLETLGQDSSLSISRNELANYFACAPSQINYVLSTRFTPERGYVIESRRGGGGYVTVVRITKSSDETIDEILSGSLSGGLTYNRAAQILDRLVMSGLLSERESRLIAATMTDKALAAPTAVVKDGIRARMMKSVICQLLKEAENKSDSE